MTGGRGVLATGGTAYNLYTILLANDTSTPQYAHQITIVNDPANADPMFVGGLNLSTTIFGEKLVNAGDSTTYTAPFNGIRLQDIMVLCPTTATQHVSVTALTI